MSQREAKVLTWNEVADFAYNKFSVWVGNDHHKWAEYAWNKLIDTGLASYVDEIDRHIVLIRLMTLGAMYKEFCYLVFDEYFSVEEVAQDWLDDEEFFCPIRIWQLVGPDFYRHDDIGEREYDDLLAEALYELINSQRIKVYRALYKGFGDDWEIFISMLASGYVNEEPQEDFTKETWEKFGERIDPESLDEDEERGFYWITLGMPSSPHENV